MSARKKEGNNIRRFAPKKLPIEYAMEGQQYATVERVVGNCQFIVMTVGNESKCASLCGAVKRNGRVKANDFVLIEALGTNENGKYQIVFRYTPEQKKILEKEGHLVKTIDPTAVKSDSIDDDGFEFEGESKAKELASQMEQVNELFVDCI